MNYNSYEACSLCGNPMHVSYMCPYNNSDSVFADSYHETYNPNWHNHSNFSWHSPSNIGSEYSKYQNQFYQSTYGYYQPPYFPNEVADQYYLEENLKKETMDKVMANLDKIDILLDEMKNMNSQPILDFDKQYAVTTRSNRKQEQDQSISFRSSEEIDNTVMPLKNNGHSNTASVFKEDFRDKYHLDEGNSFPQHNVFIPEIEIVEPEVKEDMSRIPIPHSLVNSNDFAQFCFILEVFVHKLTFFDFLCASRYLIAFVKFFIELDFVQVRLIHDTYD